MIKNAKVGDKVILTPERVKEFGTDERYENIAKIVYTISLISKQTGYSHHYYMESFVDKGQAHCDFHLNHYIKPALVIIRRP